MAKKKAKKEVVKDAEYIDLVNSVWKLGKNHSRYYNSLRLRNIHFLAGNQWIYYNSATNEIYPRIETTEDGKIPARLVFNLLLPYYKRIIALLSRNQPLAQVLAREETPESMSLAKASKNICLFYWDHLTLRLVLQDLIKWFTVCNDAFLKVTWDTKETLHGEGGEEVSTGDVGVHVISPFEIYYYPLTAKKMKEVEMILHAQRISKERCIEIWGDEAKNIETTSEAHHNYFDQHIHNFMQPLTLSEDKDDKKKDVWVLELTVKASKKYPRGKIITVAGNKLMKSKDNPYYEDGITENSFYNYIYFPDTSMPGRLWATSAFEQAIPIQKEYNAERSLVIDNFKKMAPIKWWAPSLSGIDSISDAPEVIQNVRDPVYGSPIPPQQLRPAPMPGYAARLPDKTKADMQDVLAHHEVSKGMAPPNIESGVGVETLQAKDDEVAISTSIFFLEGIRRMYQLILNRVHDNCEDERKARIIGENMQEEFFVFNNASIEDFNLQLKIINESLFMEMPANKERRIMAYWQAGLFGPPEAPNVRQRVLKMLESSTDAVDYSRQDEENAKIENRKLMAGENIEAAEEDNDDIHYTIHTNCVKENKYREDVDQVGIDNVKEHIKTHVEKQARALAAMQGMQGMQGAQGPQMPPTGAPGGVPAMGGGQPPPMPRI